MECSRKRASLSKGPMAGRPSSPESRELGEVHLRVKEEGQREERDREVRWVEGESRREKQGWEGKVWRGEAEAGSCVDSGVRTAHAL